MADYNDIVSLAPNPLDKIVQHDTITIVNDGVTVDYAAAKIVTDTRPNLYGRKCLARAKWSIDGGSNWQAMKSKLFYTYTLVTPGVTLPGLDAAISIGCSDSTVYFRTANGKHGNVTGAMADTWTPTPYTFTIEYWLYET